MSESVPPKDGNEVIAPVTDTEENENHVEDVAQGDGWADEEDVFD
jgi:hypothetical protein